MAHERVRSEHKVLVDHNKAHWDYDCDCYSFQSACAYCAIERALNKKGLKGKIDRMSYELERKVYIDVEGKVYTFNEDVLNWMGTFDTIRGPLEGVLLFKQDSTVDVRLTDHIMRTTWG